MIGSAMSSDDKKSGNGWGCLVMIAIVVVGYLGRAQLAKQGFSTVSIRYGVRASDGFFGRRVVGVFIENTDKKSSKDGGGHDHSEATVELEILHGNGDVTKKQFRIGTLKFNEKWTKEFDSPLKDVAAINYLYTCNLGAAHGTFEMNTDFKPATPSD